MSFVFFLVIGIDFTLENRRAAKAHDVHEDVGLDFLLFGILKYKISQMLLKGTQGNVLNGLAWKWEPAQKAGIVLTIRNCYSK